MQTDNRPVGPESNAEFARAQKLKQDLAKQQPTYGIRRVERRVNHKKWEEVPFMELTSGCTFRMFESDGTPVVDEKGRSQWTAACKPFKKPNGDLSINVYGA
jgi:hypothetical protein